MQLVPRSVRPALLAVALAASAHATPQTQRPLVWEVPVASSQSLLDVAVSPTGVTYGLLGSPGRVVAVDADGAVLWVTDLPGVPAGLALHPSGELSIGGWVAGSDPSVPGPLGDDDGLIVRLGSDGQILRARRIGGNRLDRLSNVAAAGEDLAVCGTSWSAAVGDAGTTPGSIYGRFDPLGDEVWLRRHVVTSQGSTELFDIFVRSDGSGLAVGHAHFAGSFAADGFTIEFDGQGATWALSLQASEWRSALELPSGDPLLLGYVAGGGGVYGVACRQGAQPWCVDTPLGTSARELLGSPTLLPTGDVLLTLFEEVPFVAPVRAGFRRLDAGTGADVDDLEVRMDALHIAHAEAMAADPRGGVRMLARRRLESDLSIVGSAVLARVAPLDPFTSTVCAGVPNSTGSAAVLDAAGSDLRADDEITLFANGLPAQKTVLFLTSRTTGLTPMLGGGRGTLCLGGTIGRFVGPGQIRTSSAEGRAALTIDLAALPQGIGTDVAAVGDTWHFQAWHRDDDPGATSNLTSAVAVTFR